MGEGSYGNLLFYKPHPSRMHALGQVELNRYPYSVERKWGKDKTSLRHQVIKQEA